MKKYIKPEMSILQTEATTILCSSNQPYSGGDPGDARARWNNGVKVTETGFAGANEVNAANLDF